LLFLLLWGAVVVADSPLLSTLVAQNTIPEKKGTALTIVNCIGYAITILSIQLTSLALSTLNSCFVYMILSIGPALALLNLSKIKVSEKG
jgi:peptidoglycan biosynthesis protein MviN/MurJ (putative lipid II flippase)